MTQHSAISKLLKTSHTAEGFPWKSGHEQQNTKVFKQYLNDVSIDEQNSYYLILNLMRLNYTVK